MIRLWDNWLQMLDDRILEYLESKGMATPALLASEVPVEGSEERVRERLLILCHSEFAAPVYGDSPGDVRDGVELTGLGQQYLDGEIDARHHAPPPEALRDVGRPSHAVRVRAEHGCAKLNTRVDP